MRLLYLHGFRSSPLSTKAQTMARSVMAYNAVVPAAQRIQWHCPQLPASPAQAMLAVMQWVRSAADNAEPMAAIGSSLGGFYAALVAQSMDCRCVLLNPAVYPARDLKASIGRVKNWHDEGNYEFTQQHVNELQAMQTAAYTQPERYPAARMLVQEGSDHAISEFDRYAQEALAFVLGSGQR